MVPQDQGTFIDGVTFANYPAGQGALGACQNVGCFCVYSSAPFSGEGLFESGYTIKTKRLRFVRT